MIPSLIDLIKQQQQQQQLTTEELRIIREMEL